MKFRDPRVLVPAPRQDDTPTLLTLVGAFVLLALVIATATWVPA